MDFFSERLRRATLKCRERIQSIPKMAVENDAQELRNSNCSISPTRLTITI